PARQARALRALAAAQLRANEPAEAARTRARLAPLEAALDKEYRARVVPLKVVPFAGQEGKTKRVVVVERFTGSPRPFCHAAYLIFGALRRSCPPGDLALVQYHLHLTGPDPLAEPDAEARWAYYAKAFPADVRFTPATLLNGRPNTAGGHLKHDRKAGDLYRDAHRNYSLLSDAVDELVETVPGVRITAEADRQGDRVGLRVAVRGLPGPDDGKRLRVVLVEEA